MQIRAVSWQGTYPLDCWKAVTTIATLIRQSHRLRLILLLVPSYRDGGQKRLVFLPGIEAELIFRLADPGRLL